MLFNSVEFLLIFLPTVFVVFFLIARINHQAAMTWLAAASVFFYGYWSLYALPIMMASICVNYLIGMWIANKSFSRRKALLILAIIGNLAALAYFKYADFFIDNTNVIRLQMGLDELDSLNVVLPVGISFFTFTQMAYLIDTYQGKASEASFLKYILFVSYFPHLLAGPLIHHRQMMPQFANPANSRIVSWKVALGLSIFTVGLAKKVLLADPLSTYVDTFYNAVLQEMPPTLWASWIGSLAYSFQLYFDFSGYSDMAVGVSLLFGIWLPFNFNSPFRATSIIDFWQRWHITLTKYVGEYLYVPLMLRFMRNVTTRNEALELLSSITPTIVVFILLGMWHGANWTFVVFGLMHGCFLAVNHIWRKLFPPSRTKQQHRSLKIVIGWTLTFLAVNISTVMFRSDSVGTAIEVYKGMLGFNGIGFNVSDTWLAAYGLVLLITVMAFPIVLLLPNTTKMEAMYNRHIANDRKLNFSLIGSCLVAMAILCYVTMNQKTTFLYFQF
ncbi:MAG: MBOAT family protein [Burkholderiaceae bacterium]|nr:MBOAT family protein [Burkholderiaceae bacterium]